MLPATLTSLVNTAEPVESIVTMEAAAESRWIDAVAVGTERPTEALGCAYLLGYVVECTLKAALGRAQGVLPAADLYSAAIRPLPPRDRHDLNALLAACLAARPSSLPALSALQTGVWQSTVSSVAHSHSVEFRYKSVAVAAVMLAPIYRDVEWIVTHAKELWT
jgi:hypothetical protein